MVSLRDAITDSARNYLCAAATAPDPWRNWLRQATSGIPGVGGAVAAGDDVSDAAGALICSDDAASPTGGGGAIATYPPAGNVPGQCELVPYLFEWEYTQTNGTRTNQTLDSLYGPIGNFVLTANSQGNTNVGIECRGVFGLGTQPPGYVRQLLGNQPHENIDPQIISLTRRDGGVDDCGPSEPQLPPEGDDVIDYDTPDGPQINIPITFSPTIPIILPGGALVIPIQACLLAICFDLNFNLSTGDITFNFGGQPESSPCCPPIDEDVLDENEDDPPPPDNPVRYVGVIINAVINGDYMSATEIGDGIGPNLFVPRLGVIRFAVEIGNRRAYTVDQPIKQLNQVVYVPGPFTAYSWSILPDKGFDVSAEGIPVSN